MFNSSFIIRSSHERTEQLCKKLILEQGVDEKAIFIIREVPFSATLKKSFQIGIDQGFKWTFCVDADVLLKSDSIRTMLAFAEKQKSKVCEVQGLILDKFFGGARDGGVHLYRTSLLKKALECIPEEGIDIRPETHTLQIMKSKGYPWVKIPYVVGIHDDEQYFFDIYRKCFVHGIKHTKHLDLFVSYWKKEKKNDKDFEIALQALSDSITYTEEVLINKNLKIYIEGFDSLNIPEKDKISTSVNLNSIDNKIFKWVSPEAYHNHYPTSAGQKSKLQTLVDIYKKVQKNNDLKKVPKSFLREIYNFSLFKNV